ncbi:splicing factor RBM22 [Seminavis robusta]|uniref:Splicing factor RBM22 n=1 Tax=Seminavis robusta TaxID=568900 RepID=A0A9N8H9A0_9STRA|nr:splicing factor RBM22 [Seminavis robusta]|eukprot:Sro198_g084130.1 splicing factor RBM22 (442) ;mRNA; r:60125-61450
MASIKRDDVKQQWEGDTEFPLVCETCLGDNPYVRMTKEAFGKKCQICEAPFTVFAWQAGTKGRLKRVEICRNCAQAKNVCQVCIYDLQYGLPVKVRDKVLRESGSASAVMAPPQSQANRAWYTAQQERALAQGASANTPNALAHAKLADMARMEPRYERNLPKLCSFFAKGECDRGSKCPFRHEMPRDRNDPMSQQNTKDRFYGTNDPVAKKIIGKQKRREFHEQKQDEEDDYERATATAYLRYVGDPPFPPTTEDDIRDQFYAFGEILAVRIQPDKGQAFIEYSQPEACELAIASLNRKTLLDRIVQVKWARAPKRGEVSAESTPNKPHNNARHNNSPPKIIRPAAPPGGLSQNKAPLPKGLLAAAVKKVTPSAEVAAIAAARKQAGSTSFARPPGVSSVPRPGGGVLRGAGAKRNNDASNKPYYPSASPSRLGSKSSSS